MKITKTQLKQLIKEEITKTLDEVATTVPGESLPGEYIQGTPFQTPSKEIPPEEMDAALKALGAGTKVKEQAIKTAKMLGIGVAEALNFLVFMATAGGIDLTGEKKMRRGPGYVPDPLDQHTSAYEESIDRDKLAILVAEEVQKIFKNK